MRALHLVAGLLLVIIITYSAADDLDLGQYTAHVCREGTFHIDWTPPAGNHSYNYIDVYYTRTPYPKITVISWLPGIGWQVVARPSRFKGRLAATSESGTTSFLLENLIRIDSGRYELSAPTTGTQTYVGTYDLIVYVEENYYPDCINNDNTTAGADEDTSTYVYTWEKPDDSPSVGVKMLPQSESAALQPQSCYFRDEKTCDVVFDREDWEVTGRVYFSVQYLFPDDFVQCESLDEPPTSLLIDIPPPRRLATSTLAAIIITCVAVVVIGCVVPPLVTRYVQKNKSKMSQKECLTFVSKCIDYIQNYTRASDFSGLYRRNTQESVMKAYVTGYKKNKSDLVKVDANFDEIPKKDLASCVKYILKIADEHWLPPEVQIQIARGDTVFQTADGAFDACAVRQQFRGTGRGTSATKRMILAMIFRHFEWFLSTTGKFDNRENIQIVDQKGLATCIAPNFFADADPPDLETSARYIAKEIEFIINLMDNTNRIFPPEDDPPEPGERSGIPLLAV